MALPDIVRQAGTRLRRELSRVAAMEPASFCKARAVANGEEVLLVAAGFYVRNDREKGSCLVVLTPSRLVYCRERDSRGRPLPDYTSSTPIEEIAQVRYKEASFASLFTRMRLAWGFVIEEHDGDFIEFQVEDAEEWHRLLTHLTDKERAPGE